MPALHGKDGMVKVATGAGKSLCMFMVPLAYSNTAVGVIISLLNALMDDQVTLKYYVPKLCNQVTKLSQLGISAIRASESTVDRIEDVTKGTYRFGLFNHQG